jgi:hypothetical protein
MFPRRRALVSPRDGEGWKALDFASTLGVDLPGGFELSPTDRAATAEKLHQYTGLPVDYILKADLRIDGGQFRQTLEGGRYANVADFIRRTSHEVAVAERNSVRHAGVGPTSESPRRF